MNVELLIIELAKMSFQYGFNYLRLSGKTEEEIQNIYEIEKAEFFKNHPSKLPEV